MLIKFVLSQGNGQEGFLPKCLFDLFSPSFFQHQKQGDQQFVLIGSNLD